MLITYSKISQLELFFLKFSFENTCFIKYLFYFILFLNFNIKISKTENFSLYYNQVVITNSRLYVKIQRLILIPKIYFRAHTIQAELHCDGNSTFAWNVPAPIARTTHYYYPLCSAPRSAEHELICTIYEYAIYLERFNTYTVPTPTPMALFSLRAHCAPKRRSNASRHAASGAHKQLDNAAINSPLHTHTHI